MKRQPSATRLILLRLFFLLSFSASTALIAAEHVSVPIHLDYPLIEQLMTRQLFDGPGQKAEILHDPAGCNKMFISDPQLAEHRNTLEINIHIDARLATGFFGTCTSLLNWEGQAKFYTVPTITAGGKSVRFKILTTQLYNLKGQLINTGQLWSLIDGLQALLGQYELDLTPAIEELNGLLPLMLSHHTAQQLRKITESLRLTQIAVKNQGIDVNLSLQVDPLPPAPGPEAPLTADEMRQLEKTWQMMDALLTSTVKQFAATTHQQVLQETLLEVLLDARYRLNDALASPVTRENDPVRHWFLDSWVRLGPVLRQIALENPGQEPLLLVSLLTATDALRSLDQLGPSIGLDISAAGLRRLSRLIIQQPGIDPLNYDNAVDPQLRRLLRLPKSVSPAKPPGVSFNLWPISSAWAKAAGKDLNLRVPKKNELPEYLPKVRDLLRQSATTASKEAELNSATAEVHRRLVLATAWQESCWRQYVVKNAKIVPLRSNSGDSGLMQMNERVWRGFYDIQKLRWDIDYNAQAGSEVLLKYLVNYALKKGEQKQPGGIDNLARATYSAYNGGPSQTSRYRNAKASPGHKKVDAAFWKKYQAVTRGKELEVAECLVGKGFSISEPGSEVAANRKVSDKSTKPQLDPTSKRLGKEWILNQDKQHYTLQLGVFSNLKAARKVADNKRIPSPVAISPLSLGKESRFVVISGSYKTKTEANKQKQHLKQLKPWIRSFADVQKSIRR